MTDDEIVEAIEQAVERADSCGTFVEHEAVEAWVSSWGDEDEKPPPSLR